VIASAAFNDRPPRAEIGPPPKRVGVPQEDRQEDGREVEEEHVIARAKATPNATNSAAKAATVDTRTANAVRAFSGCLPAGVIGRSRDTISSFTGHPHG
jgi:hypothetical protein